MAGQSSVFTMSRWSLCVSLWEAANKKAHLTHESIVGMHLFCVFFLRTWELSQMKGLRRYFQLLFVSGELFNFV